MKHLTLTTVLSFALAGALPSTSHADLKDVIIGGAIGAIIVDQAHKNKRRTTATRSARPASLNSQYSRAEKRQIQSSLNGLGFNVGVVDGSLGPRSRTAISQFQAARGEAATGQLTRPQYGALVASVSNPSAAFVVDRRLSRDEVVLMQTSLANMGFYNSRIDGQAGPGTRAARTAFLRANGYDPITTTQVQSVVIAASTAGQFVPPYLMQEAQTQYAAANGQAAPGQPQQQMVGFGAVPQQPQGFGQQPQQPQAIGVIPQPQQPQQLFGQQPQTQGTVPVFAPNSGAVQPQQGFGTQPQQPQAQTVNPLFAPAPQTQPVQPQQPAGAQLFAPAPQPVQPKAPVQGQGLFAAQTQTVPGTTASGIAGPAQAPAALAPTTQSSTLDIFQPNAATD